MAATTGIDHLGLAVENLEKTKQFFIELLGWEESGHDESYPRTAVSDGSVRLTLWQVDKTLKITAFNRRKNIGLHHLALRVSSEDQLNQIYQKIVNYPGANIEFSPEPVGSGPRKHMMCTEPGGIRIEFIWQGN